MRVLVTGAAGFIGQHVTITLQGAGHEVVGLDVRKPDGWLDEWVSVDVTKPLPRVEGLDAVIHLAAIAAPRECEKDPGRAFDVNVNGTLQVLRMALESGAKKFVFSSSAHVYDIPPKYFPTDETHPLRLNNTYTTTKILGEQLCQLFWENHGLAYTVLRLFNAYGPGQGLGYFIPDMIAKAAKGPIVLQGGNTTKDFVYVDDVAWAFVSAVETSFVGPINIGTGVETQLYDIATRIAEAVGTTCMPADEGTYFTRMRADWTRASKVLGWKPTVTVEEGLARILDETKVATVR